MSVKMRFDSPSGGVLVHRSCSVTGVVSLNGRRRSSSVCSSLLPSATAGGKSPRTHLPRSGGGALRSLQWDQVDGVFQALGKGLRDFLEAHRAEMDFLSSQMMETRRNSRLAFLYDLEKEIRVLERYIRRLEFQISKVEELHEMFWVQWRLCEGAVNMSRAFSQSPSSRASRESLLELSREHRHSMRDVSVMEGQLEVLLGELHIKMRGLIGFARLCPGDQYEVGVRLGRQRRRIRGRIDSDDRQSWDEEQMVFLPQLHHNFEIKVTEAKGLGWLLVGMVTCASADLIVAKPQLMLVDITELGTIKLQLEVIWNPFGGADRSPVSVGRQPVSSRRPTVYSRTPPNTLPFTEKPIIDGQTSLRSLVSKSGRSRVEVSLLSYLSHQSHHRPHPLSSSNPDSLTEKPAGEPESETHTGVLEPDSVQVSAECGSGSASDSSPPTVPPRILTPPTSTGLTRVSAAQRRSQSVKLGALVAELEKMLEEKTCPEKELRVLDHQILNLATILRNDLSLLRSSPSEETLTEEEVLGSFDFLSHDDNSNLGSVRLKDRGVLMNLGLHSQDSQSASEEELIVTPLTSGDWGLDLTLETHLDTCSILLQMVTGTSFSPAQRELLEELVLQAEVLDATSRLLLEKDSIFATDLLPEAQRTKDLLAFWAECVTDSGSPFYCCSDHFCRTLKKRYSHQVKARQPGQSERVFSQLLLLLQEASPLVPSPRPVCSPERVTIFQLSVHLKRCCVQELGGHISRLSGEEYILSALRSPRRRQALNKMSGRSFRELLPLGCVLQTLAALQIDSNHRVSRAAVSCLCRSAGCRTFRSKAVIYYTESLKSSDIQIQQASCLALKHLRASESAENIAELWGSADEDEVLSAAREAVASFGKKGFLAFQRMEKLGSRMKVSHQNHETETTFL